MLWKELSHSELKILLAIPSSQSYSDISKSIGLSLSYVSEKVKRLAKVARFRYWVDYRALGLSAAYLLTSYDPRLYEVLSAQRVPYVRSVARVWDREGEKLLIEVNTPLGFERVFAQVLSPAPTLVWVKAHEAKFTPTAGTLLRFEGGTLRAEWDRLPERTARGVPSSGSRMLGFLRNIDELDLLILREKEEFCFASLSEIGRTHRISQQLVSYHYRLHLKGSWRSNCVEHKVLVNPVLYKLEAAEPLIARKLLEVLSEVPSLVDAFIPEGEEETVVLLIDESLEGLAAMHKAFLRVDGVRRAELLAYIDVETFAYKGFTAHLGFSRGRWIFENIEEILKYN